MTTLRIIFDLDDTLYAEREYAYSGFRAVGRWADRRWGVCGLADDMAELLDSGHLGSLFKIAFSARRPDHTPEELAELRDVYRTHKPEIRLFDDAKWALEFFRGRCATGLITDGTTAMQASKVRALGIGADFDEIVFTHDGGGRAFHKPHPWSYIKMERVLAADGATFAYVGDNAAKDFVTPNARGWTSVQIRRAGSIHDQSVVTEGGQPHHVIDTLKDLRTVLRF